ncbi:MAG TPA: metallopeptidase family protein [Opitutaceae bacterium]|nr:metallopeptidase family protein [Opitutaceae bacterium]
MELSELIVLAEKIVGRTQRSLPAEVRPLAEAVPVSYEPLPNDAILEEGWEPDILGLFVGDPHGTDTGSSGGLPAQIILFLENIWDYAEEDLETYHEEVRLTYLHELGHYLGWDEVDLEARGLD